MATLPYSPHTLDHVIHKPISLVVRAIAPNSQVKFEREYTPDDSAMMAIRELGRDFKDCAIVVTMLSHQRTNKLQFTIESM